MEQKKAFLLSCCFQNSRIWAQICVSLLFYSCGLFIIDMWTHMLMMHKAPKQNIYLIVHTIHDMHLKKARWVSCVLLAEIRRMAVILLALTRGLPEELRNSTNLISTVYHCIYLILMHDEKASPTIIVYYCFNSMALWNMWTNCIFASPFDRH